MACWVQRLNQEPRASDNTKAHSEKLFPAGLTKEKFTFQLSDHFPLWLQVNTDIDGQKLDEIVQGWGDKNEKAIKIPFRPKSFSLP